MSALELVAFENFAARDLRAGYRIVRAQRNPGRRPDVFRRSGLLLKGDYFSICPSVSRLRGFMFLIDLRCFRRSGAPHPDLMQPNRLRPRRRGDQVDRTRNPARAAGTLSNLRGARSRQTASAGAAAGHIGLGEVINFADVLGRMHQRE